MCLATVYKESDDTIICKNDSGGGKYADPQRYYGIRDPD